MANKTSPKADGYYEAALIDAGTVLQRVATLLDEARQHVSGGPREQTIAAALADAAIEEVDTILDRIEQAVTLPASHGRYAA